jgi:hypothetical protein
MACNCYTKSMFTSQLVQAKYTFVTIPPPPQVNNTSTADLNLITPYYGDFDYVEKAYGQPLANRKYQLVPTDYARFIELYNLIVDISAKTTNPNMLLLLKLSIDALEGATNAYNLYGQTLALQVDKINLQNRFNDVLSNKNEQVTEIPSQTQGHLAITQTFTLAPVFNYYILIFGIPVYGVGFDPSKISFLVGVLSTMGINPYK